MKAPHPNEAILLRIPPQLYAEVRTALEDIGYNLEGDGNYQRLSTVPYFLRHDYERRIIS
jgi:hypothetical protein